MPVTSLHLNFSRENTFNDFTVDILPDQRPEIKEFLEVNISFEMVTADGEAISLSDQERNRIEIEHNQARICIADPAGIMQII